MSDTAKIIALIKALGGGSGGSANITEERVNALIDAKIAAIPNAEEASF